MKGFIETIWDSVKPGPRKTSPSARIRKLKTMKLKDRLAKLKAKNKSLQEQLDNQGELLVKITKDLAKLKRETAHLCPEE
jgi:hypothetical protein